MLFRSPQISASSIIAKINKDIEMDELDPLYPQYGLAKNRGYLSPSHIEAIKKYGYSKIHRKSYKIKSLQDISGGSLFG